MTPLAVIGGTGVDELDGLELLTEHVIDTPFGPSSRPVQEGRLGGATVFFLQRHGSPNAIPPHRINYRANVWALQSLGAGAVIAINSVGGITPEMQTGRLIIPDQIIDYTWGREHTFDDGVDGTLMHIDFTQPYDGPLRELLIEVATANGIAHVGRGVHAITQGPRLESAAEVQRLARDGCDVVGMTGMPEASLARELRLPYASICMVVNAAAGLDDLPLTIEHMKAILQREAAVVRRLLAAVLLRVN